MKDLFDINQQEADRDKLTNMVHVYQQSQTQREYAAYAA